MSSRRMFIAGAGAAGLALVGSGAAWRVTRVPVTATQPWQLDPTPPADVRLDAFRHAILAPNPHNRQPWEIRLVGGDEAIISCDLDRRLPQTDPFDRQIVIGFGAFLELARIAATARGMRVETTPFPEGDPSPRLDKRPIARLRFVPDTAVERSALLDAALLRRTTRKPYDLSRPVAKAIATRLIETAGPGARFQTTDVPSVVERLRALTWEAWMIEAATHRTHDESVQLMRIGAREVDANPDGIALMGPALEALSAVGLLTRSAMSNPTSFAMGSGRDMYRTMLQATPAYAWLTTEAGGRAREIEAGRSTLRFYLAARLAGLSVQPVSQALQEFPEMQGPFAQVRAALGVPPDHTLQMLLRIGYGPAVGPAPRWPLASRLKSS